MTAISVDGLRDELRTRIKNEQAFRMWIQPMVLVEASANQLRLGFPSKFTADWVRDHYQHIFQEVVGAETRFVFEQAPAAEQRAAELAEAEVPSTLPVPALADERPSSLPTTVPGPTAPARAPEPAMVSASMLEPRPPLNPNYTFDSFVVGPANELAWKAARASASDVAPRYNPLVIVGAVGLGKTHLLHAVGHAIQRLRPDARIHLRTTEEFTTDVVQGIRTQRMDEIRRLYRTCDVLLLDDIQFISSKPACQEEFFHTFNALYDRQKQIVITSDRSPRDIADIHARVQSRFDWGLVVDLKLPDVETRVAILRKKAEALRFQLADDIAQFIAQSIRSNIRELEGSLTRVLAFAEFSSRPASLSLAKEALRGVVSDKARTITCELIVKTTAQVYELKPADLKGQKRSRNVAVPRQVAMYLCRKHTQASYPEIGAALGGKDHTTALNAYNRINERLEEPEIKAKIEDIERLLLE
jgi:chromosomal replication initiator protein